MDGKGLNQMDMFSHNEYIIQVGRAVILYIFVSIYIERDPSIQCSERDENSISLHINSTDPE